MFDDARAFSHDVPLQFLPVQIGFAARVVVADCIRKWAVGAALTERERQIVEHALACNRYDLVRDIFADREVSDAG